MQEEGLLLQETQILYPSFSTRIYLTPYSVELEGGPEFILFTPSFRDGQNETQRGKLLLGQAHEAKE